MNICDLVSEIGRESEFVIYDNRKRMSNEYKKEYFKRLIKINELVFVKDNDFGYNAVPTIFNYIELAKLEIKTSKNEDIVVNCLNNILQKLTKDDFTQYPNYEIYKVFLSKVNIVE